MGTGQPNLSAAVLVAGQNFSDDPNVLVFILVAAVVGLLILAALAASWGSAVRRAKRAGEAEANAP